MNLEKSIKSVFKRYEQKYLLDNNQLFSFGKRLNQRMREDSFGIQTICNIYFDTDEYLIIRTSIEEKTYKEKLRLRSYGVPKKEDMIFAEIKRKVDGVV